MTKLLSFTVFLLCFEVYYIYKEKLTVTLRLRWTPFGGIFKEGINIRGDAAP